MIMVLMTMTLMMIMLMRIPMMMVAIVMMMVIVKVDGEGDGGDGSGCDLEGVAWRIASSSMTISRAQDIAWPEVIFCDVHFTALGIQNRFLKYGRNFRECAR
jgi:hypothetical protein